ncbi:MAG: DAK2 domain-containing protein [Actinomycetes bacterium]
MGGLSLTDVLVRVQRRLAAHRTEVDDLNVFPVPDGDTGTNMLLTVRAAVEAAHALPTGAPAAELREAVVRAALRGARGNSGVILSQVVRALAEEVDGELDVDGWRRALARGRELAWQAVAEPVEGTILTAIAVAAESAAGASGDLADVTERVRLDVHAAVARTPQQLAVLAEAGVVDAGARGFALLCDAVHGLVTGEDVDDVPPPHVHRTTPVVVEREAGSSEYRFEVQYLLELPADRAEHADETVAAELRRQLEGIGDSVVVVGAGELLTVHVHTDDVGPAIELALRHGRPSRIEVVAFAEQIAARDEARAAAAALGCVVVLPGHGLAALAEEVGAVVVHGAGGALPSVADLLDGVGAAGAERIVVLPGHRNAVPTAHQAAEVSRAEGGREMLVVDEADSPAGVLAALAVFDPSDPDTLGEMSLAAGAVTPGEVVAAVRDAETPAGAVRRGQWLGVLDGDVVAVADDPCDALEAVAGRCADAELVTLVVGADVDADEQARARDCLTAALPDAEVDLVDGGQRPARYLLGFE